MVSQKKSVSREHAPRVYKTQIEQLANVIGSMSVEHAIFA